MERYFIIVDGRVQGVGFRYFCVRHAQLHKITGSVRNLDNGMVEIFAQGEEENINQFIMDIQKGDRFIRVDHISVKKIEVVENEREFTYKW